MIQFDYETWQALFDDGRSDAALMPQPVNAMPGGPEFIYLLHSVPDAEWYAAKKANGWPR
jgi:hypothetical protein